MKEIKTKSTVKDIKVLDKSLDVTRRAKNAFIRTRDQAERTQRPEHDSYVEYAEDKAKESAEMVGNEAVHTMRRQGKKAVQKIKERRNSLLDNYHTEMLPTNIRRSRPPLLPKPAVPKRAEAPLPPKESKLPRLRLEKHLNSIVLLRRLSNRPGEKPLHSKRRKEVNKNIHFPSPTIWLNAGLFRAGQRRGFP